MKRKHSRGWPCRWSDVRTRLELEPNVSVTNCAQEGETLRAFSGTVFGGARCEAPRNR